MADINMSLSPFQINSWASVCLCVCTVLMRHLTLQIHAINDRCYNKQGSTFGFKHSIHTLNFGMGVSTRKLNEWRDCMAKCQWQCVCDVRAIAIYLFHRIESKPSTNQLKTKQEQLDTPEKWKINYETALFAFTFENNNNNKNVRQLVLSKMPEKVSDFRSTEDIVHYIRFVVYFHTIFIPIQTNHSI